MKQKSNFKKTASDPLSLIYGIDLVSRMFWDNAYSRFDTNVALPANSLEMMLFIHLNPNCRQEDISRFLKIDKGCVAKTMFYLENQDLIVRERRTSDRRAYQLSLTPAGKKMASRIAKFSNDWITQTEDPISQDDLDALVRVINALMSRI